MTRFFIFVFVGFSLTSSACGQEQDLFYMFGTRLINDSAQMALTTERDAGKNSLVSQLSVWLQKKDSGRLTLYRTKNGQCVEAYFFPGVSHKKAVVIGGIHGSELSSIAVAKELICQLSNGGQPYYNVLVIPSVFPDNAMLALHDTGNRLTGNSGRYSSQTAVDPNRQMPPPGKPFMPEYPYDVGNREIEGENRALLQLLQVYRPERMMAIHSIKDRSKAGIYADPRTTCEGIALGFETDQSLALLMARHIQAAGGACAGNRLQKAPTAVYYLDPEPVKAGQKQVRSYQVSKAKGRSWGVSLGTWCSTAVCDEKPEQSRAAMRTLTMEFPGYLMPSEFPTTGEQIRTLLSVEAYASAIVQYFIQPYFVEEESNEFSKYASK